MGREVRRLMSQAWRLLMNIYRVRLYSTKTLKPLGTLEYHKKGCQAVAFAHYQYEEPPQVVGDDDDQEDEMSEDERADRRRWLAVGNQDSRVSVWSLISFEKT